MRHCAYITKQLVIAIKGWQGRPSANNISQYFFPQKKRRDTNSKRTTTLAYNSLKKGCIS